MEIIHLKSFVFRKTESWHDDCCIRTQEVSAINDEGKFLKIRVIDSASISRGSIKYAEKEEDGLKEKVPYEEATAFMAALSFGAKFFP